MKLYPRQGLSYSGWNLSSDVMGSRLLLHWRWIFWSYLLTTMKKKHYILEVIFMTCTIIWIWLEFPLPLLIKVITINILVPIPTQAHDPCVQLFQLWEVAKGKFVSYVGIQDTRLTISSSDIQISYLQVSS